MLNSQSWLTTPVLTGGNSKCGLILQVPNILSETEEQLVFQFLMEPNKYCSNSLLISLSFSLSLSLTHTPHTHTQSSEKKLPSHVTVTDNTENTFSGPAAFSGQYGLQNIHFLFIFISLRPEIQTYSNFFPLSHLVAKKIKTVTNFRHRAVLKKETSR